MELDTFKLERTRAALATLGLDSALFCDFYSVSYLTGYTMFLENGPNPFTRGQAAVLFLPHRIVQVADAPNESAGQAGWTAESEPYQSYDYKVGPLALDLFADEVTRQFEEEAPHTGKIGVEKRFTPVALLERLQAARPNITWVDLPYSLMMGVRAVKSPAEIEKLRACGRLAEVGQEAVRKLVQEPGKSEIEIYSQAKAVMEAYLGRRFALQDALHSGPNSWEPFPGNPTNYVTRAGDMIITDMVPYLDGYWGDSCSCYVVGGETAIKEEQRVIHRIARDAFQKGFLTARPGMKAGELERIVRDEVRKHGYDYPHHTGHGVGVSNHEEPRIIIDSPTVLEAGMVVLLEPAVYKPGVGGVRQERMFLITDHGSELLSNNSLELA